MTTSSISTSNSASVESSASEASARRMTRLSQVFLLTAAVLLLVSISQPYWGLILHAPQYPGGLQMRVFVNQMTGDADPRLDEVREIDTLNHYIGMKSLYDAAQLEQAIAIPAVILMAGALVVAAVLWQRRLIWLLTLPALGFSFIFLADLAFWMTYYGQNLDPEAPLSSAIHPFTPPILGEGVIGQFRTVAYVDTGWFIVTAGAGLIAVTLVVRLLRNRASKG